jgi:mRNA interferase RelE/StbE
MDSWEIKWRKSAVKELRAINSQDAARIFQKVEALAADAFPAGSTKLSGSERAWRIRIGDYRVIYEVFAGVLCIEVVRVGHRRDVYK